MTHGFVGWAGGLDFLRMLASSLLLADTDVSLIFLVPSKGFRASAANVRHTIGRSVKRWSGRPIASDQRLQLAAMLSEIVASLGPRAHLEPIDRGGAAINAAADRLCLDIVLPAIEALDRPTVPWMGYIYDFQHRHMPHFFSSAERARRDVAFAELLRRAPAVIVNSRDTAHDVSRFLPRARADVISLPFSAAPDPAWLEASPPRPDRYSSGRPYFMICNQFWQHKDHGTAFRALAHVVSRGHDIEILCTGDPFDGRNPGYVDGLLAEASARGVRDRIRLLGMVPKQTQISLLRGSVALVQPTLFEGGPGGGAVYDAVAVGVRAVVSSLPVNREIDEPTVCFFEPRNDEELAMHMDSALNEPAPSFTNQELILRGQARRRRCGRVILDAAFRGRDAG